MMPIDLKDLQIRIAALVGTRLEEGQSIGEDLVIEIPAGYLAAVTETLVDDFDCSHLSAITAQQWADQPDWIDVLYHFWHGRGFSLRMRLPACAPEVPSICEVLPGADFYEREAAEMFGICFTGRHQTPPLLLPDDWAEGPPFIRKDVQHG